MMKKGDISAELDGARSAIRILGGVQSSPVVDVSIDGLRDRRHILIVDKVLPTPGKYPRRPGIPVKRPIS